MIVRTIRADWPRVRADARRAWQGVQATGAGAMVLLAGLWLWLFHSGRGLLRFLGAPLRWCWVYWQWTRNAREWGRLARDVPLPQLRYIVRRHRAVWPEADYVKMLQEILRHREWEERLCEPDDNTTT